MFNRGRKSNIDALLLKYLGGVDSRLCEDVEQFLNTHNHNSEIVSLKQSDKSTMIK